MHSPHSYNHNAGYFHPIPLRFGSAIFIPSRCQHICGPKPKRKETAVNSNTYIHQPTHTTNTHLTLKNVNTKQPGQLIAKQTQQTACICMQKKRVCCAVYPYKYSYMFPFPIPKKKTLLVTTNNNILKPRKKKRVQLYIVRSMNPSKENEHTTQKVR